MSFPWEFLVERWWRFNHYQSHRNKRVCRNGSSHFKIEKKSKLILFSGLLKHYNTSHPDYQNTNLAMVKIQSVIRKMSIRLRESVSFFQVFRQIVFLQTRLNFAGEFCQIGWTATWPWRTWPIVALWTRISTWRLFAKTLQKRLPTENVLSGESKLISMNDWCSDL